MIFFRKDLLSREIMSMIDDVVGKKLPTGRKFQAKVGIGNVKKKLREATRMGALKNLADNQELINKIANKRQADIRAGKYGRDKRMADYRQALKDKSLTKDDKADLKAILEHWSKGGLKAPEAKVVAATKGVSKVSARAAAKKAQLSPSPRRALPDFLNRRGSISFSKKNNPLSRQPYKPGSGGGISAGQGGGSTISSGQSSASSFRKPSLLR